MSPTDHYISPRAPPDTRGMYETILYNRRHVPKYEPTVLSVSLGELLVCFIVSVVFLKPGDWVNLLRNVLRFKAKADEYVSEVRDFVNENASDLLDASKDVGADILSINGKKYLSDREGNLRQVYDLEEVVRDIEKSRKKDKTPLVSSTGEKADEPSE